MAIRPIQRIKHVVDLSGTPASGTQLNNVIAVAKDAPVLANTTEVLTGSKINGIYLKVVVSCKTQAVGAIPNVYMAIQKNPGDNLAKPPVAAIGSSDLKNSIIHQEMTMVQNVSDGNPSVLFNGVIVIPKGMRRMAPNDKIYVMINMPSLARTECIQAHYKEFR